MRVSETMTRDVCIVRPDDTVEEAARMMAAIDVGLLPVGDGDRLIGMVTDRDIDHTGDWRRRRPRHKGRAGHDAGR